MKTIGYMDITEGKTIHRYNPEKPGQLNIFEPLQTRHERIIAGLDELKHCGNIIIYYIKGNKYRPVIRKRM